MFKLEERKKVRAYMRAVNAGEVSDPVVQFGTDANGDVIGDKGKPVPGTAAKGRDKTAETNSEPAPDYTKLTTHDALDAALGGRAKPEGWDDRDKFKVADKQEWLTKNPATGNSGGW